MYLWLLSYLLLALTPPRHDLTSRRQTIKTHPISLNFACRRVRKQPDSFATPFDRLGPSSSRSSAALLAPAKTKHAIIMHGLAESTLDAYRAAFLQAVADGRRRQLVSPQILIASYLLPALWLSIPHITRPWLYKTRWLVALLVISLNVEQISRCSSTNVAFSYGAGLVASYGSLVCMHLLIWTRPQFEAARVIKVRRRTASGLPAATDDNNSDNIVGAYARAGVGDGEQLRQRSAAAGNIAKSGSSRDVDVDTLDFEYRWQRFPHDASFIQRFGWATDLIFCFRGAGWTWSMSATPRPNIPKVIKDGDLVDIQSMQLITEAGYESQGTEAEFFRNRLKVLGLSFFSLDLIATLMVKDPFFTVGPSADFHAGQGAYIRPWYLNWMSAGLVQTYHEVFALAGVVSAVTGIFCLGDIIQYLVIRTWFPSRAIPQIFASTFGSFDQVFERGLAGWWGAWWHQTFRQQFLGPSTYLFANGFLRQGSQTAALVSLFASFFQSGILHVSGSLTTLPRTKPWRAMVFFLLQMPGIIIQQESSRLLQRFLPRLPRTVYRWANMVFAVLWLYITAPLFIDDISDNGIWLLEPVPFSIARAAGLGYPGDRWWRWDRHYGLRWFTGNVWWESGIAM